MLLVVRVALDEFNVDVLQFGRRCPAGSCSGYPCPYFQLYADVLLHDDTYLPTRMSCQSSASPVPEQGIATSLVTSGFRGKILALLLFDL